MLGTQLRHLVDLLDGDHAKIYAGLGHGDVRPRFISALRALDIKGPVSIRDLAKALAVTHSAASQTVTQMVKHGFVVLEPGADARQRIVHLTPKAEALMPLIHAEWEATEAVVAELDAELPFPLSELIPAAIRALERRPLRERIKLDG